MAAPNAPNCDNVGICCAWLAEKKRLKQVRCRRVQQDMKSQQQQAAAARPQSTDERAAAGGKESFEQGLPPSFPKDYGRRPAPPRNTMHSSPNDGGFAITRDGRTPGVLDDEGEVQDGDVEFVAT